MVGALKSAVVVALVILYLIYKPELGPESIKTFLNEKGELAPLIFMSICIFRPVLFFLPAMGLTVAAGLLFGWLWGSVYVAVGGAFSTIVGFYFARWLGRDIAKKLISRNVLLSRMNARSEEHGRYVVLYMRLFNIPWDLVSYWAGLSGIGFRDFYFSSLILLLPVSFRYTYFGSKLFEPTSPGFIVSGSIIFVMGALPFVMERWKKRNG
jgi:uncharacterized membrane protein YdjX (TVP38/TMEM64 family)